MSSLAIVFEIGETSCALPAGSMREILEEGYVAPAPMAPASIEGVLNRMGQLYVVFDLGSLVGIALEKRQKLLLFGHDQYSFAAWVDEVLGVADMDTQRVAHETALPFQAGALRFGDRVVPCLDPEALFKHVDDLI